MKANVNKLMENAAKESSGKIHAVPIPAGKRPTPESLERLDNEIAAHVAFNEAMMRRSEIFAGQK